MRNIYAVLGGEIELYSKHDHTQFKLLASAKDLAYDKAHPLKYISFASFNNTPIQFFYDCSMQPSYIDTQIATKYANPGHPILLADPPFETAVDRRNCM